MRLPEAPPRGFSDIRSIWRILVDTLNGGIQLDNWNGQIVGYTTNAVADTADSVAHTLKRIPQGFFVLNMTKGGVMYDGGVSWTKSEIFLKCTVASNDVTVIIF